MDNHDLRSILLNLQYRLSDNDRARLHFYLKNDVPRPVGDDSTLSGTLILMQSLFDQEKISEKDFTLLINAFKQIRCFDAVKLLKEHQRRMLLSGLNQSTQSLASMMPSLIEEYLDDHENDHHGSTENLILSQIDLSNHNNNIIDSNNIIIQGISSSRKQWHFIPLLTNKCFLFALILFILILGILIVILIVGNNRINSLKSDAQVKQNYIVQIQNQNNQTIEQSNSVLLEQHKTIEELNKILLTLNNQNNQTVKQSNSVLSEQNETIKQLNKILFEINNKNNQTLNRLNDILLNKSATVEQLNKTLIEIIKERNTTVIKAGRKFGGNGGGDFDDSLLPKFTSSHYLSGFIFSDIDYFDSCQFIYTSSYHNQSRIQSGSHGVSQNQINSTHKYYLDNDERIEHVQVKSFDVTFIGENKKVVRIIRGLKFVTTKGRMIPPGDQLTGDDIESEHFPGYTLGYVTGQSGAKIDQLQFFWYRTEQS